MLTLGDIAILKSKNGKKAIHEYLKEKGQVNIAPYKYIMEAMEKSYSHKPHLAQLPYDLNTNDPKKLKERLRACNRELKNAQSELKQMKESLEWFKDTKEEMTSRNEEIEDILEKGELKKQDLWSHFDDVMANSKEDSKEIMEQWEEFANHNARDRINLSDMEKFTGISEKELAEMMDDYFSGKNLFFQGYQMGMGVDELYKMADAIEYMSVQVQEDSGDPTQEEYSTSGTWLADNIREYAKKYDIKGDNENTKVYNEITNHPDYVSNDRKGSLEAEYDENNNIIGQCDESIKDIPREMSKTETKIRDFKDQQGKIKDKLGKQEKKDGK